MGQSPQTPASGSSGGLAPNIAAVLGYFIWIIAVVWLLIEPYKNDRFIRFHAFQALGFMIAIIPVWIVALIISIVLAFIPYVGPIVALVLWPVIGLGILGIWLFLMYKAYNNETWQLPVIGPFAAKQAGL